MTDGYNNRSQEMQRLFLNMKSNVQRLHEGAARMHGYFSNLDILDDPELTGRFVGDMMGIGHSYGEIYAAMGRVMNHHVRIEPVLLQPVLY